MADYTTDAGRIARMDFDLQSASDVLAADLVSTLNRGFENYPVPIHVNETQLLNMIRKDSIDLTASRILLVDGASSGIALIARRGWTSRLAAMGLALETRGKGTGSWFMTELIREARERDDREMVLEVIEQNEPAVHLYEKFGFQIVRKLIGFFYRGPTNLENAELEEMDVRKVGKLIGQFGIPDLPWQLAGETVAQMTPPVRAFCKGPAYIVLSNLDFERVVVWSLLVEPEARGHGHGTNLLQQVMANYPGKSWHAPEIYPEEMGSVFERAGFGREELSQWQMHLPLTRTA